MINLRRKLLKNSFAVATLSPLFAGGIFFPRSAHAAEWHRTSFSARSSSEALKAYGANTAIETREILINAPEIAENGAKVDVEISSNLPSTRSIALFADKNPMPLCAALEFTAPAMPYSRLQIKLAESTRLRAVVKTTDGKTYVAFRDIKITLGGCGG